MDQFTVIVSCSTAAPSPSWGSLLHGMLIERLTPEWQEKLHSAQLRPFSQWVEVKSPTLMIWHIGVVMDPLADMLATVILPGTVWHCGHLNTDMTIESVDRDSRTVAEYLKPFFLAENAPSGVYITFMTPTTHKSQGSYAIFPSVSLITRNLNSHFCVMAPDFALNDADALEQVIAHTRITRYRLETSRYALEGTWITGYTGRVLLRFEGPDPLRRLAAALFNFSAYSGIGIKTALGMGGCLVDIIEQKGRK